MSAVVRHHKRAKNLDRLPANVVPPLPFDLSVVRSRAAGAGIPILACRQADAGGIQEPRGALSGAPAGLLATRILGSVRDGNPCDETRVEGTSSRDCTGMLME